MKFRELLEGFITVDISQYQRANGGKRPNGKGTWFFFRDKQTKDVLIDINDTYTNAKDAAVKKAEAEKLSVIYLGS